MKFIYAKGACSLSVHILLRELDFPFEAIRVDLKDKKVLESYNPKSYVPALILEDGTLLTEAISILQYLSDTSGGLFMPNGSQNRATCTGWLTYISTELHKGMAPLFHKEGLKPEFLKEVEDKIHTRLKFMDDALTDTEYLIGEMTIADFYALAILRILEHVNVSLDGYQWITEYKKRLESRPLIADTIESEEKAPIAVKLNPAPYIGRNTRPTDSYKNIFTALAGILFSYSVMAQSPKAIEAPREGIVPDEQQIRSQKMEDKKTRMNWDREEQQAQKEEERRRLLDEERAKLD